MWFQTREEINRDVSRFLNSKQKKKISITVCLLAWTLQLQKVLTFSLEPEATLNGDSQSQNKCTSNFLLQRVDETLPPYLCAQLSSSGLQPSSPNCMLSICLDCLRTDSHAVNKALPHPTSSLMRAPLLLSEEPSLIKDPCAGHRRAACHLIHTSLPRGDSRNVLSPFYR